MRTKHRCADMSIMWQYTRHPPPSRVLEGAIVSMLACHMSRLVAAEGSRTDGQCQQCYCRVLLLALPAETSGRTLPEISIIQALRATGGAVTGQVPVKDAKGLCPASVQIFWHNVTSPAPWIYIQMRRSAEAKHRRQGSGYSEGATAINAARREVASTVRLQFFNWIACICSGL